jgi:hypothetical protein
MMIKNNRPVHGSDHIRTPAAGLLLLGIGIAFALRKRFVQVSNPPRHRSSALAEEAHNGIASSRGLTADVLKAEPRCAVGYYGSTSEKETLEGLQPETFHQV